jgi:tetratricopeptide (TPR) repeat protein
MGRIGFAPTFGLAALLTYTGLLSGQDEAWRGLRDSARAAMAAGEFGKAESLWLAAHAEAVKMGMPNPQFIESARELAGLWVLEQRQIEVAAQMLKDIAAVSRQLNRDPDNDLDLRLLEGRMRLSESALAQADTALQSALKLATEAYGADHPRTALVLASIGDLRFQQGSLTAAGESLRQAYGILSETSGPVLPATAETEAQLAMLLTAQGRYPDALEHARKAAAKPDADAPGAQGGILLALGTAQAALGLQSEAARSLEASCAALTRSFGAASPRIIPCMIAMADLTLASGDASRAAEWSEQAIAIAQSNLPEDSLALAAALRTAARVSVRRQQRSVEAEGYLDRATAIAEKHGRDSLLFADLLELRADVRLAAGKADEAETGYQQAEAIRESRLGSGHPDTARGLIDSARVFQQRGQSKVAESLYEKAVRTLETAWGNDSYCLVPTLESYEAFLMLQKREDDARQVRQRLDRLRARRN